MSRLLPLLAAALTASACATAFAANNSGKTYWGRDLPWAKIAEIPNARSLHAGPFSAREDKMRDLDVLTTDGRVLRLSKDPVRLAYSQRVVYGEGDAAAYASTERGRCVITRDGRVLLESTSGWTPMGQWPDVRRVDGSGSALYALVGPNRIVRIPGPGQEETFYEAKTGIRDFAASPLGVFFLGEGGLYFAAHPGQAVQLASFDAGSVARMVYGAKNNAGGSSVGGSFTGIGLSSPPYVNGWLYLVTKSGKVSYVDWDGEQHGLVDGVSLFHGYSGGDFNYYTYLDRQGNIMRMQFTGPGPERIRDADPELLDYTTFDLVRFVLRRNGELFAANENNEGNRPAAGSQPVSIKQTIEELLKIEPFSLAGMSVRGDRHADGWRLLLEDLAADARPEVQATRQLLPKILQAFDPEKVHDVQKIFEGWLSVREKIGTCLAPLRAARNDAAQDVIEDLKIANHLISDDVVPSSVAKRCEQTADRIIDQTRRKAESLPQPGAQHLGSMLKRFQLKRKIGIIEWRLYSAVEAIEKDRESGLWSAPRR